jgi:hypothetical protein
MRKFIRENSIFPKSERSANYRSRDIWDENGRERKENSMTKHKITICWEGGDASEYVCKSFGQCCDVMKEIGQLENDCFSSIFIRPYIPNVDTGKEEEPYDAKCFINDKLHLKK